MNRVLPSFVAALLLVAAWTGPTLAAPAEPDGRWMGEVRQKRKVRRAGKTTLHRPQAIRFHEGRWTTRDAERSYGGTYERRKGRYLLTYDDESEALLATRIARRIEAEHRANGEVVEAAVELLRVRTSARVRASRKRGTTIKVKERHKFRVTLTGDIETVRTGTYTNGGVLRPPPSRAPSTFEVETPYVSDPGFWDRDDLYVMRPDVEPLDLWPDEVLFPDEHGVRVIVLLPGDYRGRSNGRLSAGTLYIEDSGTSEQPILVTYAPEVGADLATVPHAAERRGLDEARLLSIRIFNQRFQHFHGLTFRDGAASSLLHTASDNVLDGCLWHETVPQPLRIRFNSLRNVVQRCVLQRFDPSQWGHNDIVAIQLSDQVLTDNCIVGNVILNYTDSYQHTDRDGEDYGLGAGTILDGNFMGFTHEAFLDEPNGQLLCGENTIDLKMGGTEQSPIRVTDNVFFGVRAAKAGCAASGSGGYAITCHRRGTWVEFEGNRFLDLDSGVFLNAFFLNTEASQGRIDPHLTFRDNLFSGVRSYSDAFPARTGRVFSGVSAATITGNVIVDAERLMEAEPLANTGDLVITGNDLHGPIELDPRDATRLTDDGNRLLPAEDGLRTRDLHVPWTDLVLRYRAPVE